MKRAVQIGWTLLKNLISVFLIIAIYGKAHDSFQKIVVSLLILIYAELVYGIAQILNANIQMAIGSEMQLLRIRQNQKDTTADADKELHNKGIVTYQKLQPIYLINMFFLGVTWIIAIYNIFVAISTYY